MSVTDFQALTLSKPSLVQNFYQFRVHLFISLGPRDYAHFFCSITINLNLITVRYAATQQGVLIYPIVSLAVSMVGICPFFI